ncbi:MAG: hypothetical protein WCK43_01390, partial [bacterium]
VRKVLENIIREQPSHQQWLDLASAVSHFDAELGRNLLARGEAGVPKAGLDSYVKTILADRRMSDDSAKQLRARIAEGVSKHGLKEHDVMARLLDSGSENVKKEIYKYLEERLGKQITEADLELYIRPITSGETAENSFLSNKFRNSPDLLNDPAVIGQVGKQKKFEAFVEKLLKSSDTAVVNSDYQKQATLGGRMREKLFLEEEVARYKSEFPLVPDLSQSWDNMDHNTKLRFSYQKNPYEKAEKAFSKIVKRPAAGKSYYQQTFDALYEMRNETGQYEAVGKKSGVRKVLENIIREQPSHQQWETFSDAIRDFDPDLAKSLKEKP